MPFLFPVTRSINLPTQIGGRDDAPIFHQFDKFSKADLTGRAEVLRSDEVVRYVKDLARQKKSWVDSGSGSLASE
jgi:hypothetical protein